MGALQKFTDFVFVTFELQLAIVAKAIKIAKLHVCTKSIKDRISMACYCC